MSLQTYPAQIIEDRIINLRPIDLLGIDRRRLEHSEFTGRFAKDGVALSLVHLDVAQFGAAMGLRPHEYLLRWRIERNEQLLKRPPQISHRGCRVDRQFPGPSRTSTVFKPFAGDSPYQWRSAWLAQSALLLSARTSLS